MAFPWGLCGGSSTENDLRTTSRIAQEECHRRTHLSSPLGALPSSTSGDLSLSVPRPAREPLKSFSSVSVPNTDGTVWVKMADTWGRKARVDRRIGF